MTWARFISWGTTILVGAAIVFLIESLINRKKKWWIFLVEALVNILLGIASSFLLMAARGAFLRSLSFLLAAMPLFCFALAVYDVIMAAIYIFRIIRIPFFLRISFASLLVVAYAAYGTVNSQIILRNEHTYTSSKLTHDHKAVFFSDLHYGISQLDFSVDAALLAIKAENPDMILLGGDIVDEYTTNEKMRSIFEKIGALNIPTYYIYGDHDRQESSGNASPAYTDEELKEALTKNGITILCDSFALIDDDIVLMGREDYSQAESRKKVADLPDYPKDRFLLNLDHSPYMVDDIKALSPDLQLSGHSRAGQFFPLKTLYSLGGSYVYGEYQYEDTQLYVSSGISGWAVPCRTQEHCFYEVINLKKA